MLYQLHEMHKTLLSPLVQWAEASSKLFTNPVSPFAHTPFAQRIAAGIPAGVIRVVLDERGRAVTTRDLSGWLERWLASGRDVGMVIGSADGLHASVKAAADLTLSLSPLTLPHGLVRVLLAEQLYRGMSLLRGHPYHRD